MRTLGQGCLTDARRGSRHHGHPGGDTACAGGSGARRRCCPRRHGAHRRNAEGTAPAHRVSTARGLFHTYTTREEPHQRSHTTMRLCLHDPMTRHEPTHAEVASARESCRARYAHLLERGRPLCTRQSAPEQPSHSSLGHRRRAARGTSLPRTPGRRYAWALWCTAFPTRGLFRNAGALPSTNYTGQTPIKEEDSRLLCGKVTLDTS